MVAQAASNFVLHEALLKALELYATLVCVCVCGCGCVCVCVCVRERESCLIYPVGSSLLGGQFKRICTGVNFRRNGWSTADFHIHVMP